MDRSGIKATEMDDKCNEGGRTLLGSGQRSREPVERHWESPAFTAPEAISLQLQRAPASADLTAKEGERSRQPRAALRPESWSSAAHNSDGANYGLTRRSAQASLELPSVPQKVGSGGRIPLRPKGRPGRTTRGTLSASGQRIPEVRRQVSPASKQRRAPPGLEASPWLSLWGEGTSRGGTHPPAAKPGQRKRKGHRAPGRSAAPHP